MMGEQLPINVKFKEEIDKQFEEFVNSFDKNSLITQQLKIAWLDGYDKGMKICLKKVVSSQSRLSKAIEDAST